MAKEVLVTVQPITGEAVYIEVQQDYAPVQAVNGRIGFVTLDKSDVGLSNVENLSILGASGHLQYQIDQLGTGYASQTEINILSGLLAQTGSNLNSAINSLSGYSNSTFSTITNLQSTGLNLQNQINNLSGYSNSNFYPNTNPSGFITGVNLSPYATVANLQSTGQNLQNQINNLDLNYASDLQLSQTGSNLQQQINNLYGSGFITGVDLSHLYPRSNPSGFITGVNLSSYATTANLAATGSTLTAQINNLSGTLTGNYASISNLALTGLNLDSKINNLSGVSVLVYGNQTIDGTKTFRNSVYIHDLYVTGTEFIANVQNNFIESSYILLNLTGGSTDGGIFFVTGSGLTGANDYGPIIGFDHSNKFKFGIARRSDDLSVLNDIAAVQDIINYSGFVNNKYATILNLASTGSNLQQQINNINSSGFITGVDLSNLYPRNNPSGFITGINTSNFYTKDNPSGFIINNGLHKYYIQTNKTDQYLQQENILTSQIHKSGMENGDLVNLYFEEPLSEGIGNVNPYSKTLKVNPGVIVDYNGGPSNRNLIKFPDDSNYSGKAIRKVRYNSTVGNGYERFVLSAGYDTTNCPIIRPKTRRLETFYDISVPNGGGIRYILFSRPNSFPFVQGTCMNLRFDFEADNNPCVISGLDINNNTPIFTLSGANYNFVQKERVILIDKGPNGSEFKHW